jgi:hypothetical protein
MLDGRPKLGNLMGWFKGERMFLDGKSILGLLKLATAKGTIITITAAGPDAREVVHSLIEHVENCFGEVHDDHLYSLTKNDDRIDAVIRHQTPEAIDLLLLFNGELRLCKEFHEHYNIAKLDEIAKRILAILKKREWQQLKDANLPPIVRVRPRSQRLLRRDVIFKTTS